MVLLFFWALFLAGAASWVRATNGRLGVWELVFARNIVFFIVLAPWAIKNTGTALGNNRRWLFIQGVAYTAFLYLYIQALLELPLSIATMLSGTGSLWVVCIVWAFFVISPAIKEVLAMFLVLGGVARQGVKSALDS